MLASFSIPDHTSIRQGTLLLSGRVPPSGALFPTGCAYETVPDKPIITGKTRGPELSSVQPLSLGQLARGSDELFAWRRQEDWVG